MSLILSDPNPCDDCEIRRKGICIFIKVNGIDKPLEPCTPQICWITRQEAYKEQATHMGELMLAFLKESKGASLKQVTFAFPIWLKQGGIEL